MTTLGDYWNCWEVNKPRYYHHTISTTLLYGLREALAQVIEEGMQECILRHQTCSLALQDGLARIGLELYVKEVSARLPTVVSVVVPQGVDWKRVVELAMVKYDCEFGGGLGPTAGGIWRIGVMGFNANLINVNKTLKVLEECLNLAKSKL